LIFQEKWNIWIGKLMMKPCQCQAPIFSTKWKWENQAGLVWYWYGEWLQSSAII